MLVLSRKVDESILVGDRIKIRIVRIQGNRVRVGIEAPEDVRIVRSELGEWPELPQEGPARVEWLPAAELSAGNF